jgi:acyl-CoA dehydrogenase
VPPAFDGPGLDLVQIAQITERIGRLSGLAGLIYAMHMSQALSIVRHGTGAFFEDFQRRMVRDQILLASGTSEKGPGGDILTSIATLNSLADGRLGGHKESPNISYLDHAGAILLTANMAQPKGPDRQVLVVLEMSNVRVSPLGSMGFLGMRGILNQPVALDFEAPREAVFPGIFAPIARRTMTPCIHVLWVALWSGIAWNAINRARLFVRQEITAQQAMTLARHELSMIANQHAIMNAMIHDTITLYGADPTSGNIDLGSSARINRLKITCSELLIDICTRALSVIGLRAYGLGGAYSLSEPLCDALSAPIMVSNTRLQMNTVAIEDFANEAL